MSYSSKRQAFLVGQGYAFKVIAHLKNIESTPDLAFAAPQDQRELLQKILVDVESKSWREEQDTAGLLADGSMFYGADGKPVRKTLARRTAGTLRDLSGGQNMAYTEQNKKAGKKKKDPQSAFFKSIKRENEKRRM